MSICITVYNQIELIRDNLNNILRYKGNDIEIILQDDCSTEDIESLVENYSDSRIKYYRNNKNLGHDRNIIEAFKNCSGKFAFLLRSSDTILEQGITKILKFIDKNLEIGYCRFSCLSEKGTIRLLYQDNISNKGLDSVELHKKILIHPSGELYNLGYFSKSDWMCYEEYLNNYFDNNSKFVVHLLMRYKLVLEAGIATSSDIVWKYSYTVKRKDVAENRSKDRLCVYHPKLQYQRYRCELSYVVEQLEGDGKNILIYDIIDRYEWLITFMFYYFNKDRDMQKHYNYDRIPFSSLKELSHFKQKTLSFSKHYNIQYNELITKKVATMSSFQLVKWKFERIFSKMNGIINAIINRLWRIKIYKGGKAKPT